MFFHTVVCLACTIWLRDRAEGRPHSNAHRRVVRSELVTIALFLTLTLSSLNADLFVILLQSSKIFTRLRELSFLHTLADIPVDEGALGVHEIELVVDTREYLSNGCGVADHTDCTHDLGKITTRDDGWWLVIDAAFEACW